MFFLRYSTAIYHFLREYRQKMTGQYNGEVDNLLFYYVYFYDLIQETYKKTKKPFRKRENYIQYES